MKILLVTWYFTPTDTIGSVRLTKLARYLLDRGHDVRVVTAAGVPAPQTLAASFPSERVARAPWIDVNRPLKLAVRSRDAIRQTLGDRTGEGEATAPSDNQAAGSSMVLPSPAGLLSRLSDVYVNATNMPDSVAGWMPLALRAARSALKGWQPDIVFASGPPFTTLLIGQVLARRLRAPLVSEFRDRWWNDPYYPPPAWRKRIERWLEERVVDQSVGLVTVSEPWAEAYRARYAKLVEVVYNGYDPADYPSRPSDGAADSTRLCIVYTGGIYPGRRDPTALFQALRQIGATPDRYHVEFVGTRTDHVTPLAESCGVADLVEVSPRIPQLASFAKQQSADVLLLMQWNDPREQGNIPGKLFDYLAARRPILGLGLEDGVPATFIRQREAGFFSNDPHAIGQQLQAWLAVKEREGKIAALPCSVREGIARDDQYRKLEMFFERLLHQERPAPAEAVAV